MGIEVTDRIDLKTINQLNCIILLVIIISNNNTFDLTADYLSSNYLIKLNISEIREKSGSQLIFMRESNLLNNTFIPALTFMKAFETIFKSCEGNDLLTKSE